LNKEVLKLSPILICEQKIKGTVYGAEGIKAKFDNGKAEVDEATAKYFARIPGYYVEDDEDTTNDGTNATNDGANDKDRQPGASGLEDDLKKFRELSWQKQKAIIEKGQVSPDRLTAIVDAPSKEEDEILGFSEAVKKAAKKALEG
jgi:hypothetical protein